VKRLDVQQSKISKAINQITDLTLCAFLSRTLESLFASVEAGPLTEYILVPLQKRARALRFQHQIHHVLAEENSKLKERIQELESENAALLVKVAELTKTCSTIPVPSRD